MTVVEFEEWVHWHKGGPCPKNRNASNWWLISHNNRLKILTVCKQDGFLAADFAWGTKSSDLAR